MLQPFHRALLAVFLTAGMLSFLTLQAHAEDIKTSPALLNLLKQMQHAYVGPMGSNVNDTMNNHPEKFASLLGLTVQRQKYYLSQNKKYAPHFDQLVKEAVELLHSLARIKQYKNPQDGSPLTNEKLEHIFYMDLGGASNSWFRQNFNINPEQVNLPFLLDQVTPPSGALFIAEDPDSIQLLGHGAGPNALPAVAGDPSITQVCPDDRTGISPWVYIDTNNNPNDKTYIFCDYGSSDSIIQTPMVDGKKHGVRLQFQKQKGDKPKYLFSRTPYVNGVIHGIEEHYLVLKTNRPWLSSRTNYVNGKREGLAYQWDITQSGQIYLEYVRPYANDQLHGMVEDYSVNGCNGNRYLYTKTTWVNGILHGPKYYYKCNGQVGSRTMYNNGQKVGN